MAVQLHKFSRGDVVETDWDDVRGQVVYTERDGQFHVWWADDTESDELAREGSVWPVTTAACECGNPFRLCHPEA